MIYLAAFLFSFASVFLKSIQTRNITGDHYRSAFVVSYLIIAVDALCVTLIVRNGWIMTVPLGIGGAFGVVTAMKLHHKFYK